MEWNHTLSWCTGGHIVVLYVLYSFISHQPSLLHWQSSQNQPSIDTWCDSEGLWHNLLHQQNMALSLTSTKNKSFIKTEVVNQRVSVTKLVGSTKYWVNQPLQLGVGRIVAFWWNRVPNAPKNLFYPVFRRKKGYSKPKIRFFGFIRNTDPTSNYSVGVILILVDTVSMKEWQVHQRRTGKSEYQNKVRT